MDIWLEMIRENNLYKRAKPAGPEEIDDAERQLALSFSSDYRELLSTVGACICFGHEINGITDEPNLNVISTTEEARKQISQVPHSWYVIEDTHMDGILILQNKNGLIYQIAPGIMPMKIADNLESYLSETKVAIKKRAIDHQNADKGSVVSASLEEAAHEILEHNYDEARKKLEDPDQVEKILQQVEKKLEKIPTVGDWFADLPATISLIRSYIRKEYSDVPIASIIAALAAALYVVSPVDLVPDFIPGVGMLDDAAVLVLCWKMIHDDVDKYQEWRKQAGKEI